MTNFTQLRIAARAYVIGVVLLGALTLAHSIHRLYAEPIGTQWLVLAALTLMTGSFTVKVPAINATLSVSETFVFASVLLFGPAAGAATVLLESLIILFWMKPQGRPIHLILFNTAAPAIAIWLSGSVFFFISGIDPYSKHATPLQGLFLPLLVFTALYFLLNSWLVAVAVGFETNQSSVQIWWKNFTWLSVNYFSGASVAALLVTRTRELDVSTLAIIVPLLVVSYLTFRTAMGRVEDSNRHLSELNRLYLSTIETLAMAIDAKDQITHGHIRRVQAYAVGLAKRVGVADIRLIKAIEAAALLHDMGKLAVPEYILNKPGRLTEAEFEKMKLHASVGADILSAIDFPYPVVPIVRHHHESWDGSGYPTGLKGTEIPIGARILSVVDCFDALTSDRPYRPKLSDQEALRILTERRGTMYDPLIVDTFSRVHAEITPEKIASNVSKAALNEITSSSQQLQAAASYPRLDDIAASSEEMLTLFELARALTGLASTADTGDVIGKHLRRLIPFSLSVLFLYDVEKDELEAKHGMGDATSLVKGLRIPLGQRLSGWVAANRQTICNSDPMLDFGEVARSLSPPLRSCISAPLLDGDELVGVLSLYSSISDGFTDDHRRVIEAVARHVAHTFKAAALRESIAKRDALTGLPQVQQLEPLLDSGLGSKSELAGVALIFVDVAHLKEINRKLGRAAGDEAIQKVAHRTRSCLRVTDILFRSNSDDFVALLSDTTSDGAEALAARIQQEVERFCGVAVNVACVIPPRDSSFEQLMAAGLRKIADAASRRRESVVH